MSSIWLDVRFTLRFLARRPAYSVIVVLTLALGIGSTTAVFSLIDGILLTPVPFKEPSEIVTLWQSKVRDGDDLGKTAPGNFLSWKNDSRFFAEMASAEPFGFDLTDGDEPERIGGWLVSSGFFDVLGVEALHGTVFSPQDYQNAEGNGVVMLSHRFWSQRYAGNPEIVGENVRLGGEPHRIVGVMPADFDFPAGRDLWVARVFTPQDANSRSETNLTVIARLAPGAGLGDARGDLSAIAARLAEQHPTTNRGLGVAVVPIEEHMLGEVRSGLLFLFWAVGFVHLIVCANVGNLVLVQGIQRRSELALRAALGARQTQLLRQMIVESLVLATLGAIPGLLLAVQGTRLASRLGVVDVPRLAEISIDGSVIGFAMLLTLVTAFVFGLLPNLRLSRPDINRDLGMGHRSAAGGVSAGRAKRLLIAIEVALAVMLLVATGLLIRSLDRLLSVDTGFVTENISVFETHVWDRFHAPDQRATFFQQTTDRLADLSGVEAAGAVSALPLFPGRNIREIPFFIEGREPPTPDQQPTALHTLASAGYFQALEIPLRKGRFFTSTDRSDTRAVILINESMASRYWPDEDPIGRRVLVHYLGRPVLREIVGIVGDTRQSSLAELPRPELYIPHAQLSYGSMTFVVRGKGASSPQLIQQIKQEIRVGAPGLPFATATTMDDVIADLVAPRRLSLQLLFFFSMIATLLAALGVYGLVSSSTQSRRHEMGMRMALGGSPQDVLKLLLGEGARWILSGIALGIVAAVLLTRLLKQFLFDIAHYDPLTLGGVCLIMGLVGLLAILVPARSAMKVTPMTVLRHD